MFTACLYDSKCTKIIQSLVFAMLTNYLTHKALLKSPVARLHSAMPLAPK